ncbi:MAG TPA: aromatic amino acid lyase [Solirubrobacteraceae bacterium]|nr:aromatic amino acid lyase [Solirubrobacteraceae bacterium]
MTVELTCRADVDLAAFRRVAWSGEEVAIAPAALELIGDRRRRFEAFLDANPQRRFYGINVHAGDGSHRALDEAARRDYARGLHSAISFGAPLPRRVVRGIVLARLTNFVEGHSGVTPGLATAVAAMLDDGAPPLPDVPAHGNGGSGEIAALGALFGSLGAQRELALKESMSLVNGSPCAAALIADAALCAEDLIAWAQRLFGLAAVAYGVAPTIFDERLDELWGDPFQARALRTLREQLPAVDAPGAGHVQPPVSFRIIPRVLGNALRVLDQVRAAATRSLSAVSDNPTLLFDGAELVDIVSTGGFHNGAAAPAIDALSATVADLAGLALHELHRLQESREALPQFDSTNLGILQMAANGYAEEARGACVPSLLGLGGRGQNDVPSPSFIAFDRYRRVHGFAAGTLACLACIAYQSLSQTGRAAPPALVDTHAAIAQLSPPLSERRSLGPELASLSGLLTSGIPA